MDWVQVCFAPSPVGMGFIVGFLRGAAGGGEAAPVRDAESGAMG